MIASRLDAPTASRGDTPTAGTAPPLILLGATPRALVAPPSLTAATEASASEEEAGTASLGELPGAGISVLPFDDALSNSL